MARWSKKPQDNIAVARGRLRKLLPGGVWHFHFKNETGRWVSRSTGHRDRAGASRWAEAYSLRLTQAEFRVPDPKRPRSAPSIPRCLVMWLRYQRQQNSPYTHRSYRSIALKFWKFLTERGTRRLADLDRAAMMAFRAWCLKRGNSKVTVDNNPIVVRSFLSWCVSKEWLTSNPASQSRHGERLFFDEVPVRKDTYTREENERIVAAATGDARRVFTLLGSWGMRISELAMLEWTDIDHGGGWVHIRNKATHDGITYHPKDKTDRKLPLEGAYVLAILAEFGVRTGRQGYVLPLPPVKSRRDYAERHFIGKLKELAGATGIKRERLTLHRFRNFFVSECAEHGVPMATVMEWVGHDEMKMVMHYYSLRDPSAREAMRRLSQSTPTSRAATPASTVTAHAADALAASPKSAAKPRRRSRRTRAARRGTSRDALDHLWSADEKTAFPARKRGKTERGGFEPPVPV